MSDQNPPAPRRMEDLLFNEKFFFSCLKISQNSEFGKLYLSQSNPTEYNSDHLKEISEWIGFPEIFSDGFASLSEYLKYCVGCFQDYEE